MNGSTNLVGLLGWPVEHSKSPAMHNAAFAHLNLNWAYVPLAVSPSSSLKAAIQGVANCGFRGANITIPYKESAMHLVDSVSEDAKTIGAINTLVMKESGEVHGENTDAPGFLKHLEDENIDVTGKSVAIIGAGGVARAILFALTKANVQKIYVVNRTAERAQALSTLGTITTLNFEKSSFQTIAENSSLIINTTSLGLKEGDPLPWSTAIPFSKFHVVYDAIYKDTPLLKKAQANGAHTLCGKGMLLWQGAIAFELWTGLKAPIEIMRQELNYV